MAVHITRLHFYVMRSCGFNLFIWPLQCMDEPSQYSEGKFALHIPIKHHFASTAACSTYYSYHMLLLSKRGNQDIKIQMSFRIDNKLLT